MTLAECTLESSISYPVTSGVSVIVPELDVPEPKLRSIDEIKKEFMKTVQDLSYSRHKWQVWQDFTELTALSIAQTMGFSRKREEKYLQTIGRYEHDEAQLFPKLLTLTIEALEVEYCDFLGQMFMELELGSKWHGQFFTPYHLCKMIAAMSVSGTDFEDEKIVTMNEPAAGSGSMIISLCEYLWEQGINFQQQLKVVAQDNDYVAAYMCYIQLSLIGCNAAVIYGNTLKMECREQWITPMAVLRGWIS